MSIEFRVLRKEHASAVICWQYAPPYDYYNFDAQNALSDLKSLLDPSNAFFAMLNPHGEIEGFCSFGLDGQVPGGDYQTPALDIGMGIRPDLTGQGRGQQYAQAVIDYGITQYGAKRLRVTIANFNQRAQRVWAQLGFESVETFLKAGSGEEFVVMLYKRDR